MKKIFLPIFALLFGFILISCNKDDLGTNSAKNENNINNPKGPNITATPNPVIAFFRGEDTTVKKTHTTYSIYTIWVCNEDGACATRVHNPFATSGKITTLGRPTWSGVGTSSIAWVQPMTVAYNGTNWGLGAIYRGDISVVNNVPTMTNLKLIADPSKTFNGYSSNEWNPVSSYNEIVMAATDIRTGIRSIQIVSGNGGMPTIFYQDTNYIAIYPTYSPDGTQIAFARQNKATKEPSILILNRADGSIVKTVALTLGPSCLNWQRTAGSNVIAFTSTVNSVTSVYGIDVSQTTPSPYTIKTNAKGSSYSPDDSKFVWWWQDGTHVYNLNTGTDANINIYGAWPSWKR